MVRRGPGSIPAGVCREISLAILKNIVSSAGAFPNFSIVKQTLKIRIQIQQYLFRLKATVLNLDHMQNMIKRWNKARLLT